jgi:hypothetical protein
MPAHCCSKVSFNPAEGIQPPPFALANGSINGAPENTDHVARHGLFWRHFI